MFANFPANSCDGDGNNGEDEIGEIDLGRGVATRDGEDERMIWPANAMLAKRRPRQMNEILVSFVLATLFHFESVDGQIEDRT